VNLYLSVQNFLEKSILLINFILDMKSWFFWAGISFIIGGIVSFAITVGAGAPLSRFEDTTGYSFGWIVAGIVLIVYGAIKRKKEKS
jgi:hypothetical protein